MKDLSVIIVSWNTKKLLKNCLASVFKQTKGFDFEVIVVDNNSTDGSASMIKREFSQVALIQNKENLGFAKANNQGIKQAKGEWLFLLNSDTVLKDNPLAKMVKFTRSKPNLAVLGPRLLFADGRPQPSMAPFFTLFQTFLWLFTGDRFLHSSPSRPRKTDWVMGAALMVKRKALKKAGLLDEKFFMYMEEVEWCYRFKKAGFEVWFYPEAEIFHLVRGSSVSGKQRAVLGIFKGLLYFYQKHFAPWQLAVLKFFLRAKAAGGWLAGSLTGNQSLRETYEKAFKLVR